MWFAYSLREKEHVFSRNTAELVVTREKCRSYKTMVFPSYFWNRVEPGPFQELYVCAKFFRCLNTCVKRSLLLDFRAIRSCENKALRAANGSEGKDGPLCARSRHISRSGTRKTSFTHTHPGTTLLYNCNIFKTVWFLSPLSMQGHLKPVWECNPYLGLGQG